jgi:hypothetical protein
MKPVHGVNLGAKTEAFNNLSRVEQRSDNEPQQIEGQAFRRMCQFLALHFAMGPSVSDSEVIRENVVLLKAFTHRDTLGRHSFALPPISILKSYADQLEDRDQEAIVYQQFNAQANARGPRWYEPKRLAD